jgi:hypothetical protein
MVLTWILYSIWYSFYLPFKCVKGISQPTWQATIIAAYSAARWVGWVVLATSLMASFLPPAILYTVQLARYRSYMQTADSSSYDDNQWGFGQVTAVLVWGPAFMQLFDIVQRNHVPSVSRSRAKERIERLRSAFKGHRTSKKRSAISQGTASNGQLDPNNTHTTPTIQAAPSQNPTASSAVHLTSPLTRAEIAEVDLGLAGNLRKRLTGGRALFCGNYVVALTCSNCIVFLAEFRCSCPEMRQGTIHPKNECRRFRQHRR